MRYHRIMLLLPSKQYLTAHTCSYYFYCMNIMPRFISQRRRGEQGLNSLFCGIMCAHPNVNNPLPIVLFTIQLHIWSRFHTKHNSYNSIPHLHVGIDTVITNLHNNNIIISTAYMTVACTPTFDLSSKIVSSESAM